MYLRTARLRLAGAEGGSQISQSFLNHPCHRVRTAQHASHGPFRVLERRHGLAEIFERRAAFVPNAARISTYTTNAIWP